MSAVSTPAENFPDNISKATSLSYCKELSVRSFNTTFVELVVDERYRRHYFKQMYK
jgi:hypothetical protein